MYIYNAEVQLSKYTPRYEALVAWAVEFSDCISAEK